MSKDALSRCRDMAALRAYIDRLDRRIVRLLDRRLAAIEKASLIKTRLRDIRDEARIADILAKVKDATRSGEADLIAAIYRHLIELSIAHERSLFRRKRKTAAPPAAAKKRPRRAAR